MKKGQKKPRHYFYGIEGLYIISHGEWSDPELRDTLTGRKCNYYDVENAIYSDFVSMLEYENPYITAEQIDFRAEEEFDQYVYNNSDLVWEFFNNACYR